MIGYTFAYTICIRSKKENSATKTFALLHIDISQYMNTNTNKIYTNTATYTNKIGVKKLLKIMHKINTKMKYELIISLLLKPSFKLNVAKVSVVYTVLFSK